MYINEQLQKISLAFKTRYVYILAYLIVDSLASPQLPVSYRFAMTYSLTYRTDS